jgi:hypothetical protein
MFGVRSTVLSDHLDNGLHGYRSLSKYETSLPLGFGMGYAYLINRRTLSGARRWVRYDYQIDG